MSEPQPSAPPPSPERALPAAPAPARPLRRRRRPARRGLTPATRSALGAWAVGLVLVALAFLWLMADYPWYLKLGGWVLLTWLADESGGWFGYIAAVLGAAPFFSGLIGYGPDAPVEWAVLYPLILVGLIGALLVKHAGGPLVLPLALAVLVLPIFVARFVGPQLDTGISLPGNERFLTYTLWPGVIGAVVSLAAFILRRVYRPRPLKARRR